MDSSERNKRLTGELKKDEVLELNEIISSAKKPICDEVFFSVNRAFKERGQGQDALKLIAKATQMILHAEDSRQPFQGRFFMDLERAFQLEDFTKADLDFICQIAEKISDCETKARLFDVLWCRRYSDNPRQYAEKAATEYYASFKRLWEFDEKKDAVDRIRRGAILVCSVSEGDTPVGTAIKEDVIQKLKGEEDFPLVLKRDFLEILYGTEWGDQNEWADYAEKVGDKFVDDRSRPYFYEFFYQVAILFNKRLKNEDKVNSLRKRIGDAYVFASESAPPDWAPNAIQQSVFLEGAMNAYKRVRNGAELLEDTHKKLERAQTGIQGCMVETETEIPVEGMEEFAERFVEGKSEYEALLNLGQGKFYRDVETISRHMAESDQHFLHRQIFSGTKVNDDGNFVHRTKPAADPDREWEREDLEISMIEFESQHGFIEAALIFEYARKDLSVRSIDLERAIGKILSENWMIPRSHLRQFEKGISRGIRGDFFFTIPTLVLQMEPLLRHLLETRGVNVTKVCPTKSLIQEEPSLNGLLEMEESRKALGPDLHLLFRTIFTEKAGWNLRNDVAHGLLNDPDFNFKRGNILLWLVIHLCVTGHLVYLQAAKDAHQEEGS